MSSKNQPRLPLNGLRAFEATARNGSLRAASEELYVTHGAVSQQVKRLETLVGAPLISRQGRGIKLTPQGKNLYEQLAPLFAQLTTISLDQGSEQLSGRLTIGCSADTASLWLVPALADFADRYPEIEVEIQEIPAGDPLPITAEIGILNRLPDSSDHNLTLLGNQWFFPVCNPSLLGKFDASDDSALQHLPLRHADNGGLWASWFRESKIEVLHTGRQFFLASATAVITGAQNGLGVALAHQLEVKDAIQSGDLITLGSTQIRSARAYFLATHNTQVSAKATVFKSWIENLTKPIKG